VLLLLALVVLVAGLARPEATVPQPRREGTVILAFDRGRRAWPPKDLEPNRIDAAKAAARTFVQKQPSTVRVGVVAFSGSGLVTQEPTTDKATVVAGDRPPHPAGRHRARERAADGALGDRRAGRCSSTAGRQPARAARAGSGLPRVGRGDPAAPTGRTPRAPTRSTSPTSRSGPG
jgi:Ca-activated chloride channel family protein